jgi:hypothetical protein
MTRTSKLIWLLPAALLVAACGGSGDDASPDQVTAPADVSEPTGGDGAVDVDEPVVPDSGAGDEAIDSGVVDAPGPALEPSASFAVPASAQPSLDSIAVSPTGDRVAIMWVAEADLATNLAVYDATTGAELVAIADDRLDGDVFWTSDDRIITVGGSGETWVWDSATLGAASDSPLAAQSGCSGSNGTVFDPVARAVFLKSDGLCRIDVATGEIVQHESEQRSTLLAVAIGGNAVYLRTTDSDGDLVLRVLDATTLEIISEGPSDGPNPVVAASGNGTIEREAGGFGYLVQPSGRVVDFDTAGITTSAAGSYYVSAFDGGEIVVSSADGGTIGTIGTGRDSVIKTAWSADDTVLVARTPAGVSVYAIG